jgi:wyosine [tRNA(Phe)-imidazoG37] synthetase (radical SAM superfamily)
MVQTLSKYKYIQEVKTDPKVGEMLIINFNPYKVCSFNCIFCGIGPTTDKIYERKCFYPPEEVFSEVRDFIENIKQPDCIWLTGLGEPSLYSGFSQLSNTIKNFYPNIKIGVSSNGSFLMFQEVREDFKICDYIVINLNSVFSDEFIQISRPHRDIKLKEVIKGIISFRKGYSGIFGVVSIFVKGINDNLKSLQALNAIIMKILPNFFVVKNFACKGYKPISDEFKDAISEAFKDFPNEIIYKY